MEDKDFGELVDEYMEQENMYHFESYQGVRDIEKFVRVLGYEDLTDFLADNSFAQRALVEAITNLERAPEEWKEKVEEALHSINEDPHDADDPAPM